ncbi:MAG: aminoacyl-tRNA hydrolase [Desulfovibrio sp.]|nr:aminoacyl-tRNA hydrolase [Desulfovibrio sp.]
MNYSGVLVGLGNPGKEYAHTRHNCGFDFVSALLSHAERTGTVRPMNGAKFSCELWQIAMPELEGTWLCATPLTFMNLSGQSVQPLLAWHKIAASQLVVVHDELDIPTGEVRFKFGGGNAGHNGLKSISQQLGSPDFYRLRMGIGRPEHKSDVINWVLGRPAAEDRDKIDSAREKAMQVLFTFSSEGLDAAVRLVKKG